MRGKPALFVAFVSTAALVWGPLPRASAQSEEEQLARKVMAAYVLNFAKYTRWPQGHFDKADAPIRIAVVDDQEFTGLLQALVQDKTVDGRPLQVRRLVPPEPGADGVVDSEKLEEFYRQLRVAEIVYVGLPHRGYARQIVERLHGVDVLTVGGVPGFGRLGGMLNLKRREGRVVFEANPSAIEATKFVVSSKVLRLAEIIEKDKQ